MKFCGQLGHGDKKPQTSPVQVTSGGLEDECVSQVSLGARHTLAVTEDGEVFSWGLGHFGVLGRSFTPYDHDPEAALAGFGEDGAPDIPAVGERHREQNEQAVEAQVAEVQRTEWNFDNLMAHLDMIANLTLVDSSDQCIPKSIESMKGVKIIGASAGHRHTLLLDERGSLYSCGAGVTGCLGHGDNDSQMFPMRIKAFGMLLCT